MSFLFFGSSLGFLVGLSLSFLFFGSSLGFLFGLSLSFLFFGSSLGFLVGLSLSLFFGSSLGFLVGLSLSLLFFSLSLCFFLGELLLFGVYIKLLLAKLLDIVIKLGVCFGILLLSVLVDQPKLLSKLGKGISLHELFHTLIVIIRCEHFLLSIIIDEVVIIDILIESAVFKRYGSKPS